jgi:hypothetical protein
VSASLSLDPLPSNIERVRLFTRDTLAGWGLDRLTDVASVVVTELVTNAFVHAKTAVTVDLQNSDGGVRISVRDGSSLSRRRWKQRKGVAPACGLELVTHLASDWGVEPTGTGKVVWALITENPVDEHASLMYFLRGHPDDIDVSYAGFRVYMIDEPSVVQQSVGRAIVTAPDGSVAWLVWEAGVRRRYLRELRAPDDQRWGAWRVGLPQPLTTGTEGRAYFSALIPDLRALWEAWRQEGA